MTFKKYCQTNKNGSDASLLFIYIYSYTSEDKSNMAVIEVNMVSGFQPMEKDRETKPRVAYNEVEYKDDGVLSFYFDEVKILSIYHSMQRNL